MEFAKDAATRQQIELHAADAGHGPSGAAAAGRAGGARQADARGVGRHHGGRGLHRRRAQSMHLHLDPVRGEELAKALADAYALPPDVVAAAKETMGEK